MSRPARPARRAPFLRLAIAGILVAALVFTIGLRLFVFPIVDDPGRADAVIVLDGGGNRHWYGVQLIVDGAADEIVHMSGWSNARREFTVGPCRHRPQRYGDDIDITCLVPDPDTTRGEIHHIVDFAQERGWQEIVVVASTDQITRARMLLSRCWDGEARFTGPDHYEPWHDRMIYETAATARALTTITAAC